MTRKYSSTSVETTLASALSSSATIMTVATATASSLFGSASLTAGNVDQFTLAIDPDTINEEIVFATGVSSDAITIVRGRAGTSAITHTGGAKVKHVLTGNDLDYFTSGIDSSVKLNGAQTLTEKTLTSPVISTIVNTGILTLPTATGTVALTTDIVVTPTSSNTLTNKSLVDPVISENPNTQTGTTYTLALTDAKQMVTLDNSASIAVTIPLNSSVAFANGAKVDFIQKGAGQVTFSGVSGVTINSTGSTATTPKLRKKFSGATAWYEGNNVWYIVGDIL